MIGKWVLFSLVSVIFDFFFIIYSKKKDKYQVHNRSSINVNFSSSLHLRDLKSSQNSWNASHTFPPSMPHFSQGFTYLKASCPFCDSILSVSAETFEYKE